MLRTLCVASLSLLFIAVVPALPASAQDEPTLLVANKDGDSLYFVDASSLTVEDSIATGRSPHEVAAAPEARRAYVANYEGSGTISVVDVDAQEQIEQWELEGYTRPHGIQVGPEEQRVYVTVEDNQGVIELDASTGQVLREFRTGQDVTHMLALPSDGNQLYASSIGSGTVTTVDLRSGDVLGHTETGEGAEGIAVAPDDETVWVTNRAEDTVSILESDSAQVLANLEAEGFPIRVTFAPDGSRALVSCARAHEVAVYDTDTRTLETRIETGEMPIGVLVPPNGNRAFVAAAGANAVSVVDLETLEVTDTVPAGRGPDGMAFVPAP